LAHEKVQGAFPSARKAHLEDRLTALTAALRRSGSAQDDRE